MLNKQPPIYNYSQYALIIFLNWLLYTNVPFLGFLRKYFIVLELIIMIPYILNYRNLKVNVSINILFIAFLAISIISAFASHTILNTNLWITVLLAFTIYEYLSHANNMDMSKLMDGIYVSLNIVTITSFIGIILVLSTNIENSNIEIISYTMGNFVQDHRFFGILNNYNLLGPLAVFSIYLAILKIIKNHKRPSGIISNALIIAIDLFLLLGTKSLSSEIALVAGLVAIPLCYITKKRKLVLLSLISVILIAVLLVISNIDLFSNILKKDLRTATGRTEIWNSCLKTIQHAPFFGYGTPKNYLEYAKSQNLFIHPAGAHNQYLEIALRYGLPALLLYSAVIIQTIYRILKSYLNDMQLTDSIYLFPIMVILFGIIHGLTEGQLMFVANPNMLIFITAFLMINKNLKDNPHENT